MSIAAFPARPVVVVLGASGMVGQAVVTALLRRGRFGVRAVTCDTHSVRSRELQRAGAELISADTADSAALRQTFAHAHGVFAITDFWAHRCPERELAEAARIAKAAAEARVAHLVWSTAEDTRRWVRPGDSRLPNRHGRWKVPASDAKGAANQRLRDLGVPCSFLYAATPWEQLLSAALTHGAEAHLALMLPQAVPLWAGIAAADIGHCVAAIFERGSWTVGRSIGIAGEHVSAEAMARSLVAALGRPVRLVTPSLDEIAALNHPAASDIAAQLRFQQLFDAEFRARRSVAEARSLHPELMGFDAWLSSRTWTRRVSSLGAGERLVA